MEHDVYSMSKLTIENYMTYYEYLQKIYNEAQNTLMNEKRIDHVKYMECIDKSGELITLFNTLEQLVLILKEVNY